MDGPEHEPVGLNDAYYGPDGYCRAMEEWAEAWRDWRVEVEDVVEVAQDKFLVTGRHFGEGLASGAKLEQWSAAMYRKTRWPRSRDLVRAVVERRTPLEAQDRAEAPSRISNGPYAVAS